MHEEFLKMKLHTENHPHWSENIEWRDGRWDIMNSAPSRGYPILHIRGKDKDGNILEPMHYAAGDGDGLMPEFDGWFVPYDINNLSNRFYQVRPVEWQPLRAKIVE